MAAKIKVWSIILAYIRLWINLHIYSGYDQINHFLWGHIYYIL